MIATKAAYQLMHEGAKALADIERAGMRIDVPYLERMLERSKTYIDELITELKASEVWEIWLRKFGAAALLGSRQQLAAVLFDEMGIECKAFTLKGKASTSKANLEDIDHPFVRKYFRLAQIQKLQSTYLKGVLREVAEDGFLHPFFNLHLVRSYRSSSDSPNFQNIPARDPRISKIIRRAFIPREGHTWLEIDFTAIEVRIAACYHEDPTMLKYIKTGHDMHTDMAAECFLLPKEQVTPTARYAGKNGFVFPAFYGDYHVGIARNMWRMIDTQRLATQDGVPMRKHLYQHGIRDQADFQAHIERVEERFWRQRFSVYDDWRNKWWRDYEHRGWFRMKTGFVCQGVYRRNEVINLPVQGSAFHCLLWSLIQLHHVLRKNKMKSQIVGQVHDSLEIDVAPNEMPDVLSEAFDIMCNRLRKHWPWIITPLEVKAEASDRNWWDKEPIQP